VSPAPRRHKCNGAGPWLDPAQSEQRTAAQWPVEKKMALAHYVVWTEAAAGSSWSAVDRILAALQKDSEPVRRAARSSQYWPMIFPMHVGQRRRCRCGGKVQPG